MKIVACLQVIFLLTNRAIFANDLSQKSQFKMTGRSISVEVRAHLIDMLENGATANQAAMQAGVHRATVFRIKSKFLQTDSEKNRPKPCRQRPTTAVQDRFLRLTALRQRFKSSVKLTANLRRLQERPPSYCTEPLLASSLIDLA